MADFSLMPCPSCGQEPGDDGFVIVTPSNGSGFEIGDHARTLALCDDRTRAGCGETIEHRSRGPRLAARADRCRAKDQLRRSATGGAGRPIRHRTETAQCPGTGTCRDNDTVRLTDKSRQQGIADAFDKRRPFWLVIATDHNTDHGIGLNGADECRNIGTLYGIE
jgi:hypothetical protein